MLEIGLLVITCFVLLSLEMFLVYLLMKLISDIDTHLKDVKKEFNKLDYTIKEIRRLLTENGSMKIGVKNKQSILNQAPTSLKEQNFKQSQNLKTTSLSSNMSKSIKPTPLKNNPADQNSKSIYKSHVNVDGKQKYVNHDININTRNIKKQPKNNKSRGNLDKKDKNQESNDIKKDRKMETEKIQSKKDKLPEEDKEVRLTKPKSLKEFKIEFK